MPMSYYKTFRVPFWVVIEKNQKMTTVMKYFEDKDAYHLKWPSIGFKDTVMAFKNKGWMHAFEREGMPGFRLHPIVFMQSVKEHVRDNMDNPYAAIGNETPPHHMDRQVDSEKDYERLFDDFLLSQPSINLSQMFQVAEKCHNEDAIKRYKLWFTEVPCEKKVLQQIADKVITIGDGEEYDLDITKATSRTVKKELDDFFKKLLGS